jgi:hypothetical protein
MKKLKTLLAIGCWALATGVFAQVFVIDVKVTDVDGKVTMFKDATSSAASGCASSDFPVMKDGVKEQHLMEDYTYITVMPYQPSSNEALYVTVELEKPDGKTLMVEMSKHLRFRSSSEDKDPVMLKDISMIEIFKREE